MLRTVFQNSKSYVIAGGFGGMGLELAYWLVQRGAKHLVLNSRRGPTKKYQHFSLQRLVDLGANIIVSQEDMTTYDGCVAVITRAAETAPIGGFFNSALVLHDALLQNQNCETFKKVCDPKIQITLHMHHITKQNCPELDHFVVFSSVVGSRGNSGQTNYAFANTAVEGICRMRKLEGLPAMAVQWGIVDDVGYVVDNIGLKFDVRALPQRIYSCMKVFERFLRGDEAVYGSRLSPNVMLKPIDHGTLIDSFSHILGGKNLHLTPSGLTMAELGADSLMAVEMKQAIEIHCQISLTAQEIRALTVSELQGLSPAKLKTEI